MFSVLSDKGKKRIYDAGMLGFLEDDDDEVSLFFKNHVFSSNVHLVLKKNILSYNMDAELTIGILETGVLWFHARDDSDDGKREIKGNLKFLFDDNLLMS